MDFQMPEWGWGDTRKRLVLLSFCKIVGGLFLDMISLCSPGWP